MITHNPDLTASVIHGLGWMYLILFFMNVWWTVRTGSLWPAFASHAAYNGIGLILMFLAPGTP